MEDLGMPHYRDPDALPPRNAIEWAMNVIYHGISNFGRGNVLFALKAGLLTGWCFISLRLPPTR